MNTYGSEKACVGVKCVADIFFSQALLRWAVIVSCNAIVGFMFAFPRDKDPYFLSGMLAGIVSWVLIYTFLEWRLAQRKATSLIRAMYVGAIIRAFLQLITVVDMLAGVFVSEACRFIGITSDGFIGAYVHTMGVGFVLSLVVAVFPLLTYVYQRIR